MTSIESPAQRVPILLGDRSYDVLIGGGLLDLPSTWQGLPLGGTAMIVTNDVVAPLYAQRLQAALTRGFGRVLQVVLPDGEDHKHWQTLQLIFDQLLAHGCDRKTVIVALGGGVVGDMAGFAAACYMRGVPFVQVPTTLLAQVDSSVGGKTAVNHPLGKNMIGAFYQPLRVICDLDVLKTLPPRELSAGLAEVIKYGPIADADFFVWLEQSMDRLLAGDADGLARAVKRSCELKAHVVGVDEKESGLRAILNFGHTFGHAIEAGLGFGVWLHGEAVGAGMVMAANLSARLGMITWGDAERIERLVARAGLPTRGPAWPADEYLAHMRLDKKAESGQIRFVLLDAMGSAVVRPVPDDIVAETLRATTAEVAAA